jgi:UDP-2,3-diacylglucosamine pyrophosphatase LpxH
MIDKQKNKLIKMYKDDFDCIISGHTHSPCYEEIEINNKKLLYMNCGDWIDHCACGIIENGEIRLESF